MTEFIESIDDEMTKIVLACNDKKKHVDPVWDRMLGDNVITGTVRSFAYIAIYILGFGTFFWWIGK